MKTSQALIFVLSTFYHIRSAVALTAMDIRDCPAPLLPRYGTMDVNDLRVDDIQVIAAMGDSVTAGLLGRNIDTEYIQFNQFKEYRGQSFTVGGDDDANSIASYIKRYNPKLFGASVGVKDAKLCPDTFFCLTPEHTPDIDYLNAAQAGATSRELEEQVDYLVKYLGKGTPLEKKWKLINVFIGSNDITISCLPDRNATEFYNNVYNNLHKLIEEVDYAFINLIGLMHFNDLIYLTRKIPGYIKHFRDDKKDLLDYECHCCAISNPSLFDLGQHITQYNEMLKAVADKLSSTMLGSVIQPLFKKTHRNVAVVYQPMNTRIPTVPYDAFSNMDGYHPNVKGYKYLSRALWKQMFLPNYLKEQESTFNESLPMFCPGEFDRLQTNKRFL